MSCQRKDDGVCSDQGTEWAEGKAGRQHLNLGGCGRRRRIYFWEGRDVRNEIEIGRDSLGKVKAGKTISG